MKMTAKQKAWLVDNCDAKADATENELSKAAGDAFTSGDLTAEKWTELGVEPEEEEANEFAKKMDAIADGIGKLTDVLVKERTDAGFAKAKVAEDKEVADEKKVADEKAEKEKATEVTSKEKEGTSELDKKIGLMGGTPDENGGEKGTVARVKASVERYDSAKTALTYPQRTKRGSTHPLAGEQVTLRGRSMDTMSQCDKALSGVWSKFQVWSATARVAGSPQRAWENFSEHEKGLLQHLAEECEWTDCDSGNPLPGKGYPGGIKALIDDTTSGGLEAAPIVFDDDVIQAPLLYGELYPLVNEVPIDRGRRIEGVSTGTVTGGWGGIDDSLIALFNTATYVAAFDTTIYRWQGSVRIGLDFLSDTPIDFNAHITAQYGERLLEDLDDVIAVGNGTTQPEGIINATGVTSVAFGAATSLSNYESLLFGVHVREKKTNLMSSAVFCGTYTSYQRARGIAVGGTDVRRIFGHDYSKREIMETPYKINESLTNAQIFYAILARYRMYRRKGFTVRTTTEGDTLIRRNEVLIVVMGRYGGQVERGATCAITTTAPA